MLCRNENLIQQFIIVALKLQFCYIEEIQISKHDKKKRIRITEFICEAGANCLVFFGSSFTALKLFNQ